MDVWNIAISVKHLEEFWLKQDPRHMETELRMSFNATIIDVVAWGKILITKLQEFYR